MTKTPVEREAKLELEADIELPDLDGVLPGVTAEPAAPLDLHAVYLDTADRRLLAVGITLRRRRGEGTTGSTWTLKLPVTGRSRQGSLDRRELEWDRDADDPPARAVELVAGVTRTEALTEVATIDTDRRRTFLTDGQGRRLAEVDDDRVTAEGGAGPVGFREVEVELAGGGPELLDAVVRRLVEGGAPAGSRQPKLSRVLGSSETEEVPVSLGPKAGLGDMAVAALESGLARWLTHEPGVRLGEDPEAIHQVRVAARRLRSDIGALADLFAPDWAGPTVEDLKWAAAALGAVRDLDVLKAWIETQAETAPPRVGSGVSALIERLDAERNDAVTALDAVLVDPRYSHVIDRLVAARREPPWAEEAGAQPTAPAGPELRRLLRRRAAKVRGQARIAGGRPAPGELHELRKRAKRLRYNAELASPVLGARAVKAAELAAELQAVLGDHHDATAAEAWLAEAARGAGPDEAFAAGFLVGAAKGEQTVAERRWPGLVQALDAKPVRTLLH